MAIIKKIKLPNEATARDIGANSSNIIYDGDAGTTTTLNDKIQSIFTAIGDINSFEIAIVSELPATGDDHTIYFVPESAGSTSHNEYMYIGDQWELIGTTTIDLSDYLQKSDITITQGLTTGIPAATITIGDTTTTIYSEEDKNFIVTFNVEYDSENDVETIISFDKSINEIFAKINDGYNILAKCCYSDYILTGHLTTYSTENDYYLCFVVHDFNGDEIYKWVYMYIEDGVDVAEVYSQEFPALPESDVEFVTDNTTLETLRNNRNKYVRWNSSEDSIYYILIHYKEAYGTSGTTSYIFLGINEVTTVEDEIWTTVYTRVIKYNTNTYESIKDNTILSLSTKQKPHTNQAQADWNESTLSSAAYIKNKPTKLSQFTNDTNFLSFESATTTFDQRYVNIDGDIISGPLTVTVGAYTTTISSHIETPSVKAVSVNSTNTTADYFYIPVAASSNRRIQISPSYVGISNATYGISLVPINSEQNGVIITGITTPADSINETYAASKGYVDNQISSITHPVTSVNGLTGAVTLSIPLITATSGLTTGITIGAININGVTTTLYAPEDTKVTQTDITGSTESAKYPVLLSAQTTTEGTITDTSVKSDNFVFNPNHNFFLISSNNTQYNGGFGLNDSETRHNYVQMSLPIVGTSTTSGLGCLQLGNQYPVASGRGNAKGALVIFGEGNVENVVYALDNTTGETITHYNNYLPMVDKAVLAAGVTTGVGSSTVPVYMAAGGELLACTLPTPTTYTMSMTGPTINLLADGVATSTITLPIWDGTLD